MREKNFLLHASPPRVTLIPSWTGGVVRRLRQGPGWWRAEQILRNQHNLRAVDVTRRQNLLMQTVLPRRARSECTLKFLMFSANPIADSFPFFSECVVAFVSSSVEQSRALPPAIPLLSQKKINTKLAELHR